MPVKKKVGDYAYDPVNILGRGQYGKVYEAEQISTKEKVAIKVISKEKALQDAYTYNALIQEMQIMKNVDSPFVIKCYDKAESKNNLYIIEELANQGSLGQLLKIKGVMNQESALYYIIQIIKGFGALIKYGIIHRDLKPGNILINNDTVKLADFGLSRCSQNMSFMKSIVGSPAYMAPQVLKKQDYSYKCDIWSFGIVCYEMLAGKIPWQIQTKIKNKKQILQQIQKQSKSGIKYPQGLQISKQFKDLIQGCLRFQEKDRYDWTQIFFHPLFKDQLQNPHKNLTQQIHIQEAFALSRLRMSIHVQNLNIETIFNDLPQNLQYKHFLIGMKIMDSDIKDNEAQCIFKSFSNGQQCIQQKQLFNKFQKHGIILRGINFSTLSRSNDEKSKEIDATMEKLRTLQAQKQIDIEDLVKKFDAQEKKSLNFEEFHNLIQSINPTMNKQQAMDLFNLINIDQKKQVRLQNYILMLSKLTMTPNIKNKQLKEELKKLKA